MAQTNTLSSVIKRLRNFIEEQTSDKQKVAATDWETLDMRNDKKQMTYQRH